MHGFPGIFGSQRNAVQRTNTSVSATTHTSPATAHTYNSTWTQLVASTAFDMSGFTLRLNTATGVSGGRSDTIAQIGVGTAGSEAVVVEVPIGFRPVGTQICLPLFVPAGSRIAVRHKSARTSLGLGYTFDYYGSPTRDEAHALPQRWMLYGKVDDASNSRGTQVTAGSTNAWGSWTSLGTSTYAHSLWVPVIDGGTVATTTALNYRSQFAIASTTDAATMVTNGTVWEGPIWSTTTAELMTCAFAPTTGSWVVGDGNFRPNGIIYQPAAAGAALSMRAMCSGTAEASVFGSMLAAVM